MRNARVPTVPTLSQQASSATASACTPSSRRVGTPATSTAREAIRDAYRAIDAAFAELSARDPLRAEGQLDAGVAAPAALARQPRRRQLAAAKSTWRCAPALPRKTSSSPASARRATSSSRRSPRTSARSTPSPPGSSIASRRLRAAQGRVARVALRVNPDIDARSHPNISTGLKSEQVRRARCRRRARSIASAGASSSLRFVGVHIHIGSQITTAEPLARAAARAGHAGAGAARGRLHARARRSWRRSRHRATKDGR